MSIEIDLDGHVAIVTGGGRGLGEAIATTLGEAGADVAVAARTAEEIEETAASVEAIGCEAAAIPIDLTDPDDVEELAEATQRRLGVPSILVNNAGVNISRPLGEYAVEELDTMLNVNLRGALLMSQAFRRAFGQSETHATGRIVNVSSVYARLGVPTKAGYGMTKAGCHGLTVGLAADLAPDDITVNTVTPGRIRIDRIDETMAGEGDEFDVSRIPLGDLGGPDDVANACLFFVSSLADYITGAELVVDGGISFTSGPYPITPND